MSEISEVLVVGEDLYREGRAVEVVAPGFQGANNSKEFSIINIVVPFRGGERLRQVGAWMPVAVGVGLEKNGTRCVLGCVGGDGEGGGEIGEVKDGFCEEEAFERVKGGLARRGPIPGKVLLGEIKEGAGDV